MHPDKIQLCVVLVDWTVESTQELRLGEATGAGSVPFLILVLGAKMECLHIVNEI